MRVLLHIGMPKAGSTALQEGLAAARAELRAEGVHYPKAPVIGHNANFLMTGLMPFEALPRYLRHSLRNRPDPAALFDRWLGELPERMRKAGAETLLMSAENLFEIATPGPAAKLRELLVGIGARRIEVVAYVRRPSDWYLSAAQQVLRASHKVRRVGPVSYRGPIETFARHVADPGATRVFVYDRRGFPDGDILAHFAREALDMPRLATPAEAERQHNATLSAEGMALLQEYRKTNHRGANSVFTRDTSRYRKALMEAEAALGPSRPRLLPALQDRLDHGSPDLLWLRDAHGLSFEGVDYGRIDTTPWRMAPGRVEEICQIDPARRTELVNRALHLLCADG